MDGEEVMEGSRWVELGFHHILTNPGDWENKDLKQMRHSRPPADAQVVCCERNAMPSS